MGKMGRSRGGWGMGPNRNLHPRQRLKKARFKMKFSFQFLR